MKIKIISSLLLSGMVIGCFVIGMDDRAQEEGNDCARRLYNRLCDMRDQNRNLRKRGGENPSLEEIMQFVKENPENEEVKNVKNATQKFRDVFLEYFSSSVDSSLQKIVNDTSDTMMTKLKEYAQEEGNTEIADLLGNEKLPIVFSCTPIYQVLVGCPPDLGKNEPGL